MCDYVLLSKVAVSDLETKWLSSEIGHLIIQYVVQNKRKKETHLTGVVCTRSEILHAICVMGFV